MLVDYRPSKKAYRLCVLQERFPYPYAFGRKLRMKVFGRAKKRIADRGEYRRERRWESARTEFLSDVLLCQDVF